MCITCIKYEPSLSICCGIKGSVLLQLTVNLLSFRFSLSLALLYLVCHDEICLMQLLVSLHSLLIMMIVGGQYMSIVISRFHESDGSSPPSSAQMT